jgi:hypothetical protein
MIFDALLCSVANLVCRVVHKFPALVCPVQKKHTETLPRTLIFLILTQLEL